ncbi:L-aspartate oxidase [Leucobacter luti]|uniref:L-aspartate oxidase n=1 Tax=Leucobacter luti TaxID=340320 RepID=UPI003CFF9AB1
MILVIGAGVAGISAALSALDAAAGSQLEVVLATPGTILEHSPGARDAVLDAALDAALGASLGGGNTALAQGGIAAAIGPGDSPERHHADTLAAGGGIVDREAAAVLTREGAELVRGLLDQGFPADRDASGALDFGLEGAHGMPRIVHAGEDRTGAALHATLVAQVRREVAAGRLRVLERRSAVRLLATDGAVQGAVLRAFTDDATESGEEERVWASAVVLATGGFAALFPRTTNHAGARGQGIVLAAQAGALLADLEFIQFHPTVLAGTGHLISEAVRGAGAVLLDAQGHRFMPDVDPMAELAPRDVVSRAIHRVVAEQGGAPVFLDATTIERAGGRGTLAERFPGITAAVSASGLDWAREPVPVSPAAHYTMGGVLSDLDGRSTLPGLFVSGEIASTGVHGANRLASNSLLEGLVFGRRSGIAAVDYALNGAWSTVGTGFHALAGSAEEAGPLPAPEAVGETGDGASATLRVADALASGLGIERDREGLERSAAGFSRESGPEAALAAAVCAAALLREESRGAHQRSDFPLPAGGARSAGGDRAVPAPTRRALRCRFAAPPVLAADTERQHPAHAIPPSPAAEPEGAAGSSPRRSFASC